MPAVGLFEPATKYIVLEYLWFKMAAPFVDTWSVESFHSQLCRQDIKAQIDFENSAESGSPTVFITC